MNIVISTQTKIAVRIQWDHVISVQKWYFFRDGIRVATSNNINQTSTTFSIPDANEHTYMVQAVGRQNKILSSGSVTVNKAQPQPIATGSGAGARRYGSSYNQLQASDLSKLDVLIVTDNALSAPSDLTAAGGKTRVLLYRSAISCQPGDISVPYVTAVANNWLLKDSSDALIYNKYFKINNILDIFNPNVSIAIANDVVSKCKANGFAGVWFDDVVANCLALCNAFPKGVTQAQWYSALVSHIVAIGSIIKSAGLEMVCNAAGTTTNDGSGTAAFWKDLFPGVTGLTCEYWEEVDDENTYPPFKIESFDWMGHWDTWRSLHTLCQEHGVAFLPIIYGILDSVNVLYLRATFLLDYDGGKSALILLNDANPTTGVWSKNMGKSNGPAALSGQTYSRSFANGNISINPYSGPPAIIS